MSNKFGIVAVIVLTSLVSCEDPDSANEANQALEFCIEMTDALVDGYIKCGVILEGSYTPMTDKEKEENCVDSGLDSDEFVPKYADDCLAALRSPADCEKADSVMPGACNAVFGGENVDVEDTDGENADPAIEFCTSMLDVTVEGMINCEMIDPDDYTPLTDEEKEKICVDNGASGATVNDEYVADCLYDLRYPDDCEETYGEESVMPESCLKAVPD